ncbi:MAG: glutamate--cysteine ligase [Burkholderiaceae bacterium]|nr:glutamate--cysteine ligase [Burkholderiaceae bacterium]
MDKIAFTPSAANSLGIELELQLIDPATLDLAACADELLAQIAGHPMADRIKPEITLSMIELNSSVHEHPMGLLAEMREMRDIICQAADAVGASVCGGGAHPFMRWQERAISDAPRFKYLAEMYGYLARQFTVFGQHIHVGVKSGDEAIALTRRLSAYVPHLIAMSASSPYSEGVDTLFACSRLNAVNSFPLSGHMPAEINDWYGFEAHMSQLYSFGLAESIKDLYWDIRPKPDFGTVEVRICDTPLTVERACQIAAFVQALAVMVMREREPASGVWLPYRNNVFQASRFGTQGHYVTPSGDRLRLLDHLRGTFGRLAPIAEELGTTDMLSALCADMLKQGNDARWMRNTYHTSRNLPSVVQAMSDRFSGRDRKAVEMDVEADSPLVTPERERRRIRASSEPLVDVQQFAAPEESAMLQPARLH